MAELTDTDLTQLERYDDGSMTGDERAAFEVELSRRPELRAALDGARGVATALPTLAEHSLPSAKEQQLIAAALPTSTRGASRWWPVLVAAGLAALGLWRFGFDTIENAGGVVTVDGKTVVAGESIISGDRVITGESSAAVVRRRESRWLVPPTSEVRLRGNVLERGAVVIEGRAPLYVAAHAIDIDGEVVISMEPLEGSFRETTHLEPGAVMDTRVIRTALLAAGGGLTFYVLSGEAWVTPPDALPPVKVEAGKTWSASSPPSRGSKAPAPLLQRAAEARNSTMPAPLEAGIGAIADELQARELEAIARSAALIASATDAGRTQHPLTRDGIQAAVREAKPELRECYESWLQQQPKLAGDVSINFVIDANDAGQGGVQRLSIVDGGLGHTMLEGCVLNVMGELSFERPSSPLNVTYPLRFDTADAGS